MQGRIFVLTLLTMTTVLAGCTDSGPAAGEGSVRLVVVDDATQDLVIHLEGVYAHVAATTDSWQRVSDAADVTLDGTGTSDLSGHVEATTYDLLRVVFTSAEKDGTPLVLTKTGFELPLPFSVSDGGQTDLEVRFQWDVALFDSTEGPAFTPVLRSVRFLEDGVETVNQDAGELQVVTRDVVARMRVFDSAGVQAFESDFVAADWTQPVLAASGNLTFASSASETLNKGATIDKVTWTFDDGVVMEGQSVIRGLTELRNHTLTMTVTDSLGASDDQTLVLALLPAKLQNKFSFSGTVTHVANAGGAVSGCGSAPAAGVNYVTSTFEVDSLLMPDGTPAIGISQVETSVTASGAVADIGAQTNDGAGTKIHGPANTNFPGEAQYTTNYNPLDAEAKQPASGTWSTKVWGCNAVNANFNGHVLVTWLTGDVDNLDYIRWAASFDDGHQHTH